MEPFELDEINESRMILLDFLVGAYPRGIQEERLIRSMLGLPRPIGRALTRRDLAYLQGLGLIETFVQENPVNGDRAVYWRLTTKGKKFNELGRPWEKVEDFN